MNAESYGFVKRGSLLVPEILISKPEDLPDICTWQMCSQGCVPLQDSCEVFKKRVKSKVSIFAVTIV
jgi:hypothetical protein